MASFLLNNAFLLNKVSVVLLLNFITVFASPISLPCPTATVAPESGASATVKTINVLSGTLAVPSVITTVEVPIPTASHITDSPITSTRPAAITIPTYTNSSTQGFGAAAPTACSLTYTPSQVIPTDIPTADSYVAPDGIRKYYRVPEDLSGRILQTTGYVFGGPTFPASNSFDLALTQCATYCDEFRTLGHGPCLSFNIFTVYETDYNDCTPTFECRFSASAFDDSQYTQEYYFMSGNDRINLTSVAWTTHGGTCPLNVDYSPELWTSSGMDDWLYGVASTHGLLNKTGFTGKLMSALGWQNYDCTNPEAAASNECGNNVPSYGVNPCAVWVNRQMTLYQSYANNMISLFNWWNTFKGFEGGPIFQSFWNSDVPPQGTFNTKQFIESSVDALLGCIPVVGGYLQTADSIFLAYEAALPDDDVPVKNPSSADQWQKFMAGVSAASVNTANGIDKNATASGNTDAILDIMKDGAFFLDSADGIEIHVDSAWINYSPLFFSQAAVAAMQVQNVFLLRFPTTGACTKSSADALLALFQDGNDSGTAWCDGDGSHAILPIAGWNMEVYRSMSPATKEPFNLTLAQVSNSAEQCQGGFSPSNTKISSYKPAPNSGVNYQDVVANLTAPCVWNLPVIDWETWKPVMVSQSKAAGFTYYTGGPTGQTNTPTAVNLGLPDARAVPDAINWFAYQLGFQSSHTFCIEAYSNSPHQPYLHEPQCKDGQTFPKVLDIQK